jgi:hypothetical protein
MVKKKKRIKFKKRRRGGQEHAGGEKAETPPPLPLMGTGPFASVAGGPRQLDSLTLMQLAAQLGKSVSEITSEDLLLLAQSGQLMPELTHTTRVTVPLELKPGRPMRYVGEIEATSPLKDFRYIIDTVEPLGKLPVHERADIKERPKVAFNLAAEDCSAVLTRIEENKAAVTNGVGWVLNRGGESEVIRQEGDNDFFYGPSYDTKPVIEKVGVGEVDETVAVTGGYDSTVMLVGGNITLGNALSFIKSSREIRDSVRGDAPPAYLVELCPWEQGVYKARAFRVNPQVSDEDVDAAVQTARGVLDDYLHKQQQLAFGAKMTTGYAGKRDRAGRFATARAIKRFASAYADKKFGGQYGDQVGQVVQATIDNFERLGQDTPLSEGFEVLLQQRAAVAVGQAALGEALQNTGVLEGIHLSDKVADRVGLTDVGRELETTAAGFNEGAPEGSQKKAGIIWAMTMLTGPIGKGGLVLKPLVHAAVEADADIDEASMLAVTANLFEVALCSLYKPTDEPDYDGMVSLSVARGPWREALWKHYPIGGLNEPEDVGEALRMFWKSPYLIGQGRRDVGEAIKKLTGHDIEELLDSKELLEIHASPLAEMVHMGLEVEVEKGGENVEMLREEIERIERLTDDDIRRMLEAENRSRSREQRRPVNEQEIESRRLSLEKEAEECRGSIEKSREMMESMGGIKARISGGDYSKGLLNELSGKDNETATREYENTKKWYEQRDNMKKTPVKKLLGDTDEKEVLSAVGEVQTSHVPKDRVLGEAQELIRDFAFAAMRRSETDEGTVINDIVDVANHRMRVWRMHDITAENLPQFAREVAFTDYWMAGRDQPLELAVLNIPPELRDDYQKITATYVNIITSLPDDLK